MGFRSLVAVAALGAARAQLVHSPPGDFDAELKRLGELGPREQPVPKGLNSPTICDPNVKQHSGYLEVASGTNYFFWMFESRRSPSTDPLILWLTGGPGCSSQLALLAENGPCKVNQDGSGTTLNKYSWTEQANVMWVDQPSDTGFSTGQPTVRNEDGVAVNMFAFIKKFYETLPQYKSNDFYIFGESYGGHFVPAVSHYLWQQIKSGGIQVNFKGLGIGNGLTDPEEQYKWYAQMALDGGKSEGGTLQKGVVDQSTYETMKANAVPCVQQIHDCNSAANSSACNTAYAICNDNELSPYEQTGYNPYDMRIPCQVQPLCYDFSNVGTFLNDPNTQQQLGVSKSWSSCNDVVNMAFQLDWMKNFHTLIPDMLADNIKVLIYAGDVDFICNWLGNKHWTLAMQWPHQAEFQAAQDAPYTVGGTQAGRLRTSNGFHFLQVFQAGHMVPMDQPVVALTMVNDFITGKLPEKAKATLDTCTGSADPTGLPLCFKGSESILGISENVTVKVTSFAAGKGAMDFVAAGFKAVQCSDLPYTKSGQDIAVDLSSCSGAAGITLSAKWCSDTQTIQVSVTDSAVPIPITVTLTKDACTTELIV